MHGDGNILIQTKRCRKDIFRHLKHAKLYINDLEVIHVEMFLTPHGRSEANCGNLVMRYYNPRSRTNIQVWHCISL